jgi:hypothetical protein
MIFGCGYCLNEVLDFIHCHKAADKVRQFEARLHHCSAVSKKQQNAKIHKIFTTQCRADEAVQRWSRFLQLQDEIQQELTDGIVDAEEWADDLDILEEQIHETKAALSAHRAALLKLTKEGLAKGGSGHRERYLENFLLREKAAQHQEKWRRRIGLTGPSWKVKGCKAMGGCCARGSGCCSRHRMVFSSGEKAYSHCTAECACCTEHYGIE